jgi:hypothetical protein
LALFTTLFCSQNTVQLMTASMFHVTNLTPGSECNSMRWSPRRRGWGSADARAKMDALTPWRNEEDVFKPHSFRGEVQQHVANTHPTTMSTGSTSVDDEKEKAKFAVGAAARRLLLAEDVDCEWEIKSPTKPPATGEWQRYWNTVYP